MNLALEHLETGRRAELIRAFWDAWETSAFGCAQVARQVGITLSDAQKLLTTREGLPSPGLARGHGVPESLVCRS